MSSPVIVSAVRSPIGRAPQGQLAAVRPDDLLSTVISCALARTPHLGSADVNDLIVGCALPGGEQGFNIARIAAVLLGWDHVPAVTVNRFCTSSLQAVRMAAQSVRCGDADVVIAAGVESQSRLTRGHSDNWPGTHNPVFAAAQQRTVEHLRGRGEPWTDPRAAGRLPDPYLPVVLAAEHTARHYGISRAAMDAYAVRSQMLAEEAWRSGFFRPEVVEIPTGVQDHKCVRDECVRTGVSAETLASLPPAACPGGLVTAGNSAPLSDGAAAVVVMDESAAQARGITPLARILATGVSALTPETEGPAPVHSVRMALARARLDLADLDVIAGNEPFAAQMLAFCAELKLDPHRVNTHGGSIALGEPYGAAGARLITTALNTLRQDDATLALVSVVAAGGQGMAVLLERLS